MVKTEVKTIGDVTFTTTQLPAMRAYSLFVRLVKAIGPAASVLMGADKNLDLTKLAPVLSGALANLDTATAEQIALDTLSNTMASVNGGPLITLSDRSKMDAVFSGRIKMMFQAIAFAVATNFADFTEGTDLPESSPDPSLGNS